MESLGNERTHAQDLAKVKKYLRETVCQKIFKLNPDDRLITIPGNHDHRHSGIFRTKWGRANFDSHFPAWAQPRFFPELNLFVACFDSNCVVDRLALSMGHVDGTAFAPIENALKEYRGNVLGATRLTTTRLVKYRYNGLDWLTHTFELASDNDTTYSNVYNSTARQVDVAGDVVLREEQQKVLRIYSNPHLKIDAE